MNETLPPPPAPTTPTASSKITGKQKTIIAVAALMALGLYGTFADNSEAAVDDEPVTLNASEAVEEPKPEPEAEPTPEPVSSTKIEPTPEPETKPEPVPEPKPTAKTAVEEPTIGQNGVEMVYLSLFRSKVDPAHALSDDDAIGLGQAVCGLLDASISLDDLLIYMVLEFDHMDPGDIGTVAGLAIGAFCPQHEWQIDAIGF